MAKTHEAVVPLIAEHSINNEKNSEKVSLRTRLAMGGAAVLMTTGLALGSVMHEDNLPVANADKCYVVGGAGDGRGDGARGTLEAQGRLAGCNEGVENIPWTGDFWPASGTQRNREAIVAPANDLTNRLNNTPPWQRKVVFGFSAGAQIANDALHQTVGRNIDFDMIGGPNTRTGVFNSPVYNLPLVPFIAGDLVGIADDRPMAAARPELDIRVQAEYVKGDLAANLQPQGLDPFALISGLDVMARTGAHRIPALHEPVVADFYDGNGVRHIVRDDGSPFTRTGENNPAVVNPNPNPQIPPVIPGIPAIEMPAPAPRQMTTQELVEDIATNVVPDFTPPAPAPARAPEAAVPVVDDSFMQDLGLGGMMDW